MKIHCTCAPKRTATCNKCSRIRMAIMLKNGNNHLKTSGPNGRLNNPVWYNYYSKNRKPDNIIIAGMVQRLSTSDYAGKFNVLLFFDNLTGTQIQKITS
jgi:hypothetical protein